MEHEFQMSPMPQSLVSRRDMLRTAALATLGAGVLGLYIIARMIIEDGRLERELLHGGQPDDEEPERAPAMFRDRYDTGYRDGYDDAVESLQFANLPQRPRKGKHKRKAAAGNMVRAELPEIRPAVALPQA